MCSDTHLAVAHGPPMPPSGLIRYVLDRRNMDGGCAGLSSREVCVGMGCCEEKQALYVMINGEYEHEQEQEQRQEQEQKRKLNQERINQPSRFKSETLADIHKSNRTRSSS